MPSNWEEVKSFFKRNLPWIFLVIGLLILIVYVLVKLAEASSVVADVDAFPKDNYLATALLSLATALISGGVFAAVLKSLQFSNVFGEELEKIIYNQKFLSDQKGIVRIWQNVTNALYQEPDIRKAIGRPCYESIVDFYVGKDIKFYYENVEHHFEVQWVAGTNNQEIKIDFVHTMDIVSSSLEEIELTPTSTQQVNAVEENSYATEFHEIIGKGKSRKEIKILPIEKRDNAQKGTKFDDEIIVRNSIVLSGKKRYKIKRVVSHKQILAKDRTYKFCCKRHLKDLKVTVSSPRDLAVDFFSAGTLDEFDPCPNHKTSAIAVEYKDIIFPRQGYVLVFG